MQNGHGSQSWFDPLNIKVKCGRRQVRGNLFSEGVICDWNRIPAAIKSRVRRHFRFEAKWSETEAKFFSLRCEKKFFFRLFRIDAKRRNLKRNKNGTKRKQNEKEAKNCHHFCFEAKWSQTEAKNCHHFRFEAKRKRKTAIISLRSEIETKFISLWREKMKWSKNKMKKKRKLQSEKG